MKVAVGFALPNEPEGTIHGNPIPAGYARVGVDEVMSGYDSLEIDIPEGEGEQTLGYVRHWVSFHVERTASCFQNWRQGHRLL